MKKCLMMTAHTTRADLVRVGVTDAGADELLAFRDRLMAKHAERGWSDAAWGGVAVSVDTALLAGGK